VYIRRQGGYTPTLCANWRGTCFSPVPVWGLSWFCLTSQRRGTS
jgi:hypothetical protein